MKIALVVPGRFHAFDLARALLTRGHDVTVLTNYPAWAARRFGMPDGHVRSFTLHGMLTRLIDFIDRPTIAQWCHPVTHRMFGRWAAGVLVRERWDVIHCWSGVSEELLTSPAARDALTLLMRGSTHIATQRRLLDEESARVSTVIDRPGDWTVAREEREYALVDHIAVLSTFALRSFVQEGLPPERVSVLPLGVDVDVFKATPAAVAARHRRILSGQPLRILYSGAVSYRKGLQDLASTITRLAAGNFKFTLAGEITPEARNLIASLGARVEILGKLPHAQLPRAYQA
ncbi:MAG: glycosyltransferase family 4 protein, partial [Vicinamibacterales bacterium]